MEFAVNRLTDSILKAQAELDIKRNKMKNKNSYCKLEETVVTYLSLSWDLEMPLSPLDAPPPDPVMYCNT